VEFVEASSFTRYLPRYLDDEGFRILQLYLAENPNAGDVIAGTGGLRKLRWRDERRGKGKRGGLRIIYYYLAEGSQIWLVALYDKHEADDLTATERRFYRGLIEEIKAAWARKKNT